MSNEPVSLNVDNEGIAIVRMEDEAGRNAISEEMAFALQKTFAEVSMREDVKVVVIAGLPGYFSTGAQSETFL